MRIAMISHSTSPWVVPYDSYLKRAGHEVLVISLHPHKPENVDTVFIGREPYDINRGKTAFFTCVPRVRRILRKYNPDLVLGTYLISNGLTAAMAWKGPLVVSSQGSDGADRLIEQGIPSWLARRMIRWTCNRADRVHAVSNQWRDEIIRTGVAAEKICVVPLGIDTRRFVPSEQPIENDTPHIVCTRKHEPVYRIDTVLEALSHLKQQEIPFKATLAASGSLWQSHRDLSTRLGLNGQVTFTGDIPHTKVVDLLRAADVFVSATVSDGTASSLLESMSMGVFPVVSDIEANRMWIDDKRTGLFFETGSAESAAAALAKALRDPELRRKGREENRRMVVGRADYEITMKQFIGHLEDVVERRRSKTR